MPRRKKHEDHLNHEAWAIPYGDLVTLLLAFFVVMYAISSVNEGKYRVLSDSLFAAFRGAPRTMQPIQVGEKQVGSGADVKTTLVEQAMIEGQPRSMLAPVPVKTGMPQSPSAEASDISMKQSARARALQQVADQVARAMDDLVKANLVVVRRTDFWIEVEIKTDILFPSASAQLEPNAVGVIEKLGEAVAPFPNPIRVEGHTDNRPIKTVAFISNWELSAARAGSVVRVLASKGVAPSRLAVIGYGENRPMLANDSVEGRNANRRVVVVILSADVTSSAPRPSSSDPADPTATPPSTAAPGDPATPDPGAPATATPAPVEAASVPAGAPQTPASSPLPIAANTAPRASSP
jgi:chemotaxis protein MotB